MFKSDFYDKHYQGVKAPINNTPINWVIASHIDDWRFLVIFLQEKINDMRGE